MLLRSAWDKIRGKITKSEMCRSWDAEGSGKSKRSSRDKGIYTTGWDSGGKVEREKNAACQMES
jgi:hypothetical protein